MDAAFPNLADLVLGIEQSYAAQRRMPTLILLYASIDIVGALEAPAGKASWRSFTAWAERYLLAAKPLPCTSQDLWGARCGSLHTLSAESEQQQYGARRVLYTWHPKTPGDLAEQTGGIKPGDVAIQVEDLIDAFRTGLSVYLDEAGTDPTRRAVVLDQVNRWLVFVPGR
jgi:hypothetical protein